MKTKLKNIVNNAFSNQMSFEKTTKGYEVQQISTNFWVKSKNCIIVCNDLDELKEINKRCELGLKIQ